MPNSKNGNAALAGGAGSDSVAKYTNPAQRILDRLDHVRKSGKGWIARCPAHEDRTASLSIAEGEGGTCLIHCFSGCRAADVVAALGLELGDLFVPRPTQNLSHAERAQLREFARQAQWRAALNALGLESKIVQIAGAQLLLGHPLNAEDQQRLVRACQLIDDARGVLHA